MKAKFKRPCPQRQAFTLVEMLVVIAIVGILAGVLVASLSGSTDSANVARCLANLKNLASACQTYGMNTGTYPLAGNCVMLSIDESRGMRNVKKNYREIPGWISTMSQGKYPSTSYSKSPPISLYSADDDAAQFALTNGALWKFVSGNRNTYVCPLHAQKGKNGARPQWSYLMSAYFTWDASGRSFVEDPRREYGHVVRPDKKLLFCEVPFSGYNTWEPEGEGGSEDTDAILQYSSSGIDNGTSGKSAGGGGNEQIGVNHKKGREAFAHVAFADGHVEKLRIPVKNGKPDTSQMSELASWLAVGYDCSFNAGVYKRLKD